MEPKRLKELKLAGYANLREHPELGGLFSSLKGKHQWQVISLNDSVLYDLGEMLGDFLEELLGVKLEELGFLFRFEPDGILEQVFPPKVYSGNYDGLALSFGDSNDGLVLKFGDAEIPLIPIQTESAEGVKGPSVVNEALQFRIPSSKAVGFLSEQTNEGRTSVSLTLSMQATTGERYRISVPVAVEPGVTKINIEDYVGYGAGKIGVKPIPSGSNPTEGSFLVSRGSTLYENLKYPVLAGETSVDAYIMEVSENTTSEYGGFFVTIQDSSGLNWNVFSNTSLAKQLKAFAYLDESKAKSLNLQSKAEKIPGLNKVALPLWQVINACPAMYSLRVKPERSFAKDKYTADVIVFQGEPNIDNVLTPAKIGEKMALVGLPESQHPQLKSAAAPF